MAIKKPKHSATWLSKKQNITILPDFLFCPASSSTSSTGTSSFPAPERSRHQGSTGPPFTFGRFSRVDTSEMPFFWCWCCLTKIGIDTKVRSMVVLSLVDLKQNHDAIYVETKASTPSSDLFLIYIPLKRNNMPQEIHWDHRTENA